MALANLRNPYTFDFIPQDCNQSYPPVMHYAINPLTRNVTKSWLRRAPVYCSGPATKPNIGKDGFQLCLNVRNYLASEISVKTDEKSIVVEAKHEERQDDHGYVSRQFTRRVDLPEGVNAEGVVATLSAEGILTIKAPAAEGNVRQIQVQQVGPTRSALNDQPALEEKPTISDDEKVEVEIEAEKN